MTEAKYEELVSTLTDAGVALRDMNGEYRSTYEIFADLAAKWDSLSSMTQIISENSALLQRRIVK